MFVLTHSSAEPRQRCLDPTTTDQTDNNSNSPRHARPATAHASTGSSQPATARRCEMTDSLSSCWDEEESDAGQHDVVLLLQRVHTPRNASSEWGGQLKQQIENRTAGPEDFLRPGPAFGLVQCYIRRSKVKTGVPHAMLMGRLA